MKCQCLDRINKRLAEDNFKLKVIYVGGCDVNSDQPDIPAGTCDPFICAAKMFLDPLEGLNRGQSISHLPVSYCPFCGVKTGYKQPRWLREEGVHEN